MTNPEWPDDLPDFGAGDMPMGDDAFPGDGTLPEFEAIAAAEMEDLAASLDDDIPADDELPVPEMPVMEEPDMPEPPDPGAPDLDMGGMDMGGFADELSDLDADLGMELDPGLELDALPGLDAGVDLPDPGDLDMADPGMLDPIPPAPDEPAADLPEVDIPAPGEPDAPDIGSAAFRAGEGAAPGGFSADLPDLPDFGEGPSADLTSVSVSSDGGTRTIKLTTTLELPAHGV